MGTKHAESVSGGIARAMVRMMRTPSDEQVMFRSEEVSEVLGISKRAVHRMEIEGTVRKFTMDERRIPAASVVEILQALIAERTAELEALKLRVDLLQKMAAAVEPTLKAQGKE